MARPTAGPRAKAPEKGSFPLDHLNECRPTIEEYYRCMEKHQNLAPKCREEAREYLQCRMQRGLMLPESTEKWLPQTQFVDMRYKVNDMEREIEARGVSPIDRAFQRRAVPHGYEVDPKMDKEPSPPSQ
eukprot:Sspe_Gene.60045::Locus_33034_Transcript_3_3_Confidence_0.375_Length_6303::g.60045::m.60045/K18183/COX19; cytochrome c oxidase assembly protein subunit 19